MAALERIDEVLYAPEINLEIKSVEKFSFDNNISLLDVTFSYDKQAGFLIDRLNLNIQKGEKIAFVGASGAGKTTIMDLIAGFYKADGGMVEIDGIPTSNLSKKSRQTLFGMVSQSTFLFNGHIAENLSLGRGQVTDEEIKKALEIAQLSNFVENLPEKLLTNIGDNGIKLSGGQRQRISIARAILKDPPIILLDEATSNLDSASETLIQKAFDQIFQDRTVIVIAHRLSTIQNCDRIVVLENGKIVQVGNHKELIKEGGPYKKMIEMQTFAN
jgi:subfamily B ATP-binding cassette protein MsbA